MLGIGEILSALNIVEKLGRFLSWGVGKRKRPQETVAGRFIRLLAPLIPVMYTDMTVDGCLKGLGQQVWSMGINILDALLGLLLVWTLLPSYALTAYIGIIYFTELLNFVFSLARLSRILRSGAF